MVERDMIAVVQKQVLFLLTAPGSNPGREMAFFLGLLLAHIRQVFRNAARALNLVVCTVHFLPRSNAAPIDTVPSLE